MHQTAWGPAWGSQLIPSISYVAVVLQKVAFSNLRGLNKSQPNLLDLGHTVEGRGLASLAEPVLGTPVVPFSPFYFGVSLLKGYPYYYGVTGEPRVAHYSHCSPTSSIHREILGVISGRYWVILG